LQQLNSAYIIANLDDGMPYIKQIAHTWLVNNNTPQGHHCSGIGLTFIYVDICDRIYGF